MLFRSNLVDVNLFHAGEPWAEERRPAAQAVVVRRLAELDAVLSGREFLAGEFSVADIMVASVLRLLDDSGLKEPLPAVCAYEARCLARAAFKKARADQVAMYAPGLAAA